MEITWLILVLHIIAASISIPHALLYKKNPRSALGWIAVCLAYPLVGPALYYLFGVNRVRTRARLLDGKPVAGWFSYERSDLESNHKLTIPDVLPGAANNPAIKSLALASTAVTRRPLILDNHVTPFFTGDAAYAAMLESIEHAQHSVCLSTYLFETNQTGMRFIRAMEAARGRGVEVRVLLDGFGELYSFPLAGSLIKKTGVSITRFIPPRFIPPELHINLRNHRKLLIVDYQYGFTGGMNIGDRHLKVRPNGKPGINDIHFRLEGSIVKQLQEVFEEDWAFASHQPLRNLPPVKPSFAGQAVCRVVTDGPNEDFEKLLTIITSACALARERIAIITPYFLPPAVLINALQSATLRGVEVSIVLPAHSNQWIVDWATRNMLWELLQYGVNIYYQPPPFDHSKLLMIDDHYAHIGSANLDPRSLRLNFELTVEIFDKSFVDNLWTHFCLVRDRSRKVTLREVDSRPFLLRIRDALAWLFSPYL